MQPISFPPLVPSGRQYSPGTFPEEVFTAQNGAVTRLRFGNRRVNSELSLTFSNITDANAALILQNFEAVMGGDYHAVFTSANVAAGVSADLVPWIVESNSALKWKYSAPPSVQSIKPGRSTVTCSFVGELEGA